MTKVDLYEKKYVDVLLGVNSDNRRIPLKEIIFYGSYPDNPIPISNIKTIIIETMDGDTKKFNFKKSTNKDK